MKNLMLSDLGATANDFEDGKFNSRFNYLCFI